MDFGNLSIYKKMFNIDLEEFCGNKLGDTWFYSIPLFKNSQRHVSNEKRAPVV